MLPGPRVHDGVDQLVSRAGLPAHGGGPGTGASRVREGGTVVKALPDHGPHGSQGVLVRPGGADTHAAEERGPAGGALVAVGRADGARVLGGRLGAVTALGLVEGIPETGAGRGEGAAALGGVPRVPEVGAVVVAGCAEHGCAITESLALSQTR